MPERVTVLGDVVRRPSYPWTATVHSLLRHLGGRGLCVPEPLDLADGYEYVRFLPGDAGENAWSHCNNLQGVRSAGTLLRTMHDATTTWVPPTDAVWAFPDSPPSESSVICHGDPKPPNMTWEQGKAIGLFDWEVARPAPRLEDVAYAIQWIAPFYEGAQERARRGLPPDSDPLERANAFLDGYGWEGGLDVEDVVRTRRRQSIDEVESLGRQGFEPQATWLADGAVAAWREAVDQP